MPGSASQASTAPGASTRTGCASKYHSRQRSLKDIAAETGIPVDALATAARQAGILVRRGISGRAHPLATLGRPGAFSPDVWNVFAHLAPSSASEGSLALPGQPGLRPAARQLGTRSAILTSPVRQLETAVGTPLLRTQPDGRLALTVTASDSPAT